MVNDIPSSMHFDSLNANHILAIANLFKIYFFLVYSAPLSDSYLESKMFPGNNINISLSNFSLANIFDGLSQIGDNPDTFPAIF